MPAQSDSPPLSGGSHRDLSEDRSIPAASHPILVRVDVVIDGLRQRSDINGCRASVVEEQINGRHRVLTESGELIRVRPCNIRVLSPSPSASGADDLRDSPSAYEGATSAMRISRPSNAELDRSCTAARWSG